MKVRWIVASAALSVVFAGLTVAAAIRYLLPQLEAASQDFATVTQEEMNAYFEWVNSGVAYYPMVPWLAASALVAGLAALALTARRAQLRSGG